MKVVVLAGGLGTRLREETEFRPKPMIEVGGKPILWHIMKNFSHFGHTEFVVCIGYLGNVIREYFLNYHSMVRDFTMRLGSEEIEFSGAEIDDWRVTIADTGDATPTGGRIALAAPHLGNETFMATYGDGLSDVDVDELLAFHRAHGKLATVTAVRPLIRFGIMELDGSGKVERFREKPQGRDWVSAGFFVFEPGVLDYLDPTSVLEQEPMEKLAADGQLVAFRHDGFWQPMDTYRELELLNKLWDEGRPPWVLWD
jgi:glucose-1-phosphate cytidylyltransferase